MKSGHLSPQFLDGSPFHHLDLPSESEAKSSAVFLVGSQSLCIYFNLTGVTIRESNPSNKARSTNPPR